MKCRFPPGSAAWRVGEEVGCRYWVTQKRGCHIFRVKNPHCRVGSLLDKFAPGLRLLSEARLKEAKFGGDACVEDEGRINLGLEATHICQQ